MSTIQIEIDGITLTAQTGESIIQVADRANIYIPRYCYHKKLSVAASCRMCLVEVKNAPKTLPACATPIVANMQIYTRSEKALFSQKTVMEFLLINHPLDCPICDQGGECELQDLAFGYGKGISRFTEGKRSIDDENLGPLIATEMTRCIQCTRCVRFGDEIAGIRELGAMGRGEQLAIQTYVGKAIESELSGNLIDVCPVGALTSKPYRFSARAWELNQHAAIAPHDCLGSNIYIHTRGEIYSPTRYVMRVIPRVNESINEMWLSDRDRFSYEAIHSQERLLKPMIKRGNQWQEVAWEVAFTEVNQRLDSLLQTTTASDIGALISPNATLEEHYLLQKWLRQIGSNNIDHRLHQTDFRHQAYAPLYPNLGFPITDLENQQTLLLIGSNIRMEQPLAAQRIRKAVKCGAHILVVNPVAYDFKLNLSLQCIVGGDAFVLTLAKIFQAIASQTQTIVSDTLPAWLRAVSPSAVENKMAHLLITAARKSILLGVYAINHPQAAIIYSIAHGISQLLNIKVGLLTEGANSAGAWLAGAVPHRLTGGKAILNLVFMPESYLENQWLLIS